MTTSSRKLVRTRDDVPFPDCVSIVTETLPDPGPGEVLVRTHYAGVNAADWLTATGSYLAPTPPPHDLGMESAGEVVAAGPDVTDLQPGDYVLGFGGFKEYFIAPAARLLRIPVINPQVVALGVGGLTASIALHVVGEMRSGETVLVTAAAGGTGQFAVQLARETGCHVIGTCGSDSKAGMLRALGCDRPINYREEDVAAVLKAEYPRGIDLVFDSVGGTLFDTALDALAVGGRLLVIGLMSEYQTGPEIVTGPRIGYKLLARSVSVRGFWLSHFYAQYGPRHIKQLIDQLRASQITAEIDPNLFNGLDGVIPAIEHLYSGRSQGKVVVRFGQPLSRDA